MEFEKLQQIICDTLNVEKDEVTLESKFVDNLGADSLDLMQIVMALEEEYDVQVADDDLANIVTVGDALEMMEKAKNQ